VVVGGRISRGRIVGRYRGEKTALLGLGLQGRGGGVGVVVDWRGRGEARGLGCRPETSQATLQKRAVAIFSFVKWHRFLGWFLSLRAVDKTPGGSPVLRDTGRKPGAVSDAAGLACLDSRSRLAICRQRSS